MEIAKIIKNIESDILDYEKILEAQIIEKCPFIIEIGALTVGTDKDGLVISQNVRFPMQFTQNAVNEILAMNWKNGNSEIIKPIVYSKNEWYLKELNSMKDSFKILKQNQEIKTC